MITLFPWAQRMLEIAKGVTPDVTAEDLITEDGAWISYATAERLIEVYRRLEYDIHYDLPLRVACPFKRKGLVFSYEESDVIVSFWNEEME